MFSLFLKAVGYKKHISLKYNALPRQFNCFLFVFYCKYMRIVKLMQQHVSKKSGQKTGEVWNAL